MVGSEHGGDVQASATAQNRGARRRERTRQALLDASRRVMAGRPIESVTIASITEAADVAFGSFYNHFDSKDHIVETLLTEELDTLATSFAAQSQLPAPDQLAVMLRAFTRRIAADPGWGGLIHNLLSLDASLTHPAQAGIARWLSDAVGAGEFPRVDPFIAFASLRGLLCGVSGFALRPGIRRSAEAEVAAAGLRLLGTPPAEATAIAGRPHDIDGFWPPNTVEEWPTQR